MISTRCDAVSAEQSPRLVDIKEGVYQFEWYMRCKKGECKEVVRFADTYPGTNVCCCSGSSLMRLLLAGVLLLGIS